MHWSSAVLTPRHAQKWRQKTSKLTFGYHTGDKKYIVSTLFGYDALRPGGHHHPEVCTALTSHSVLMKVVLVDVKREKELYGNIRSINVRVRKTEKRGEEGERGVGLYDTGRDAFGPGKLEIKGRHVILNCFLYRYVEVVELLVVTWLLLPVTFFLLA